MKENDSDGDGRLSYPEFKKSLKQFLNIKAEEEQEEEEEYEDE